MSTINCPKCNNQILDKTEICPYCGFNIQEYTKKTEDKTKQKTYIEYIMETLENEQKKEDTKVEQQLNNATFYKLFSIFNKSIIASICYFSMFAGFFLFLKTLASNSKNYNPYSVYSCFILVITFILGAAFLIDGIKQISEVVQLRNTYKGDKKKYDEEIVRHHIRQKDYDEFMKDEIKSIYAKNSKNKTNHNKNKNGLPFMCIIPALLLLGICWPLAIVWMFGYAFISEHSSLTPIVYVVIIVIVILFLLYSCVS